MQPQDPYQPRPQEPHYVPPPGVQNQTPQPYQPQYPAQPQSGQVVTSPSYDFIMNPEQPKRPSPLTTSSMPIKIAIVVGGLLLLIIVFSIGKNLLGPKSTTPLFLSVAQQQQSIIHITTAAQEQTSLSSNHQNFNYTAQLGVTSAQADLISYLATNKQKVNDKALNLKVSAATDSRLTDAANASDYDSVYTTVMKEQLTAYMQGLNQTYNSTKGANGRALLEKDYKAAQLLMKQLDQKD